MPEWKNGRYNGQKEILNYTVMVKRYFYFMPSPFQWLRCVYV